MICTDQITYFTEILPTLNNFHWDYKDFQFRCMHHLSYSLDLKNILRGGQNEMTLLRKFSFDSAPASLLSGRNYRYYTIIN